MDNPFHYWQLMRLRSSGQSQIQANLEVQTWLQERFPMALLEPDYPDSQFQRQLCNCWREQEQDGDLAQLSLRCFISHQIHQACLHLAQRYGERYGLSSQELLPLVLDDEGKLDSVYRPLSLEILESYNPDKSALSTWTRQLAYNHPGLNRVLLDKGIYRASDWAILNDTNAEQLERILRDYHLCSNHEITQALSLLQQYQQIYRRDRLLQRRLGQRGRCQVPTEEQLQQMNPTVSSGVVLKQLKHLASQLREYRVHVRSGNPRLYQPRDEQELETLVGQQPGDWGAMEDESDRFLQAYRQALKDTLAGAIAQVLKTNLDKLRCRKNGRDYAYLQGLHLSQCQGLSMMKIAPQIGLTSQVQVTRLLNLKRLRLEVRHLLIAKLYQRLTQEALNYIPIERLRAIDQTLETLLTELVDDIMAESAAGTQSAQPCQHVSRFNAALCRAICPLRQSFE
ncbi:hypothetical protein [Sodalinema gerasimenkoae]|uniref:hypothetical protein n=1 Tax=Sodalinema gerasimenkoae TaxID=2862348 RepID=UPI0013588D32|nr:hypothetical protein [Sodalinema gerasimenkoae]